MSVIRHYRPFDDFRKLENEVSDIFRTFNSQFGNMNNLPINIWEDDDQYRVNVLTPGFDIEHIDIEATAQYVEIKAERESLGEDSDPIVNEIPLGKFKRRINFDKPINTSKAKTSMKQGMLTLILPKMEEAKSVRLTPELLEA